MTRVNNESINQEKMNAQTNIKCLLWSMQFAFEVLIKHFGFNCFRNFVLISTCRKPAVDIAIHVLIYFTTLQPPSNVLFDDRDALNKIGTLYSCSAEQLEAWAALGLQALGSVTEWTYAQSAIFDVLYGEHTSLFSLKLPVHNTGIALRKTSLVL